MNPAHGSVRGRTRAGRSVDEQSGSAVETTAAERTTGSMGGNDLEDNANTTDPTDFNNFYNATTGDYHGP